MPLTGSIFWIYDVFISKNYYYYYYSHSVRNTLINAIGKRKRTPNADCRVPTGGVCVHRATVPCRSPGVRGSQLLGERRLRHPRLPRPRRQRGWTAAPRCLSGNHASVGVRRRLRLDHLSKEHARPAPRRLSRLHRRHVQRPGRRQLRPRHFQARVLYLSSSLVGGFGYKSRCQLHRTGDKRVLT